MSFTLEQVVREQRAELDAAGISINAAQNIIVSTNPDKVIRVEHNTPSYLVRRTVTQLIEQSHAARRAAQQNKQTKLL